MLLLNSVDSEGASSEKAKGGLIDRLRKMLTEKPPIPEVIQQRINFLSEGALDDRMKGLLQAFGNDELDRLIRSFDCMVYKKGPGGKNIPDDEAIREKLLNHFYPRERGLTH